MPSTTRKALQGNLKDLGVYVRNSNTQLQFLIQNSFEKTSESIVSDLDGKKLIFYIYFIDENAKKTGIEYVLGRSLQRELGDMSQLDEAMNSLVHISDGKHNSMTIFLFFNLLDFVRFTGFRGIEGRLTSLEKLRLETIERETEVFIILNPINTINKC